MRISAIILLLLSCFGRAETIAQNLLQEPRKIVIDRKHKRLLISNYLSGDIVQVDENDRQSFFVRNAGFMEGMELVGDTLYGIAGSRRIRAYDLNTRQMVLDTMIPGSPNDELKNIIYDSAGHFFISCPDENSIYRMPVSGDTAWVFVKDHGLIKPNGMCLERKRNRLLTIQESLYASVYAVSLSDSSVKKVGNTDFKAPSSIVVANNGRYYLSGYYMRGIFELDLGSTSSEDPEFSVFGAYYLTYDNINNCLLYTLPSSNRWVRLSLDPRDPNR